MKQDEKAGGSTCEESLLALYTEKYVPVTRTWKTEGSRRYLTILLRARRKNGVFVSHVCLLFRWGELLNKCCCFDFCLFSAVGKQLSPESASIWLIRLDHQQSNQGLFMFGVRDAILIHKWKTTSLLFFFGSWGQWCHRGHRGTSTQL